MENVLNVCKVIIAVVLTGLSYLFGAFDTPIIVLAIFIVMDWLTGMTTAIIYKNLSSGKGLKGAFKKVGILCGVIIAVLLDRLLGNDSFMFRTLVIYYFISNEGISIIENLGKMGIPFPKKIISILEQLREKSDKGNKE